jgi:hypothetical protein
MRITFKGNGVVWDAERGKNLCKFEGGGFKEGVWHEGEFTTDDPRTIELLQNYPTVPADAMKYYLEEKAKKEAEAAADTGDNYEEMTVAELKTFAKENNIDLEDAKKKADIIALLRK